MNVDVLVLLALLLVIAYAMNVVPVLGPPLWTVVALFVVQGDVWLVPAVIASTAAAALGRVTLALISRRIGRGLFGARPEEIEAVAGLFDRPPRQVAPAAFAYSLALPTSWLFMGAGVLRTPLRPIFLGYWAGRVAVDTFLVVGATTASAALVRDAATGPQAVAMQVFGIVTFLLFLRVPWVRWLARFAVRRPAAQTVEASYLR